MSSADAAVTPSDTAPLADTTSPAADAPTADAPTAPEPCMLKLDGDASTLSDPGASASTPSIAYRSDRLAVVWLRSAPVGHPVVRMRMLDRDGAPIKGEETVGPDSHAWAELAADGSGFGMCFHTDPQYKSRLAFRRIAVDGTLAAWRDLSPDYGSCYSMLALPGGGFALGARHSESKQGKASYRVDLLRLDASGALLGKAFELSTRAVSHGASLAVTPAGVLYVAYTVGDDTTGNSAARVMVQRFDASGSPVGAARAATSGVHGAASPALVVIDDALLLAYGEEQPALQDVRADRALFVTRLDAQGAPATTPIKLTGEGLRASYISWRSTESGAALSFTQSQELELGAQGQHFEVKVMLAHLDASGRRLQDDIEVARENAQYNTVGRPQLAFVPSARREDRRLAVVWHQRPGQDINAHRAVHLRMLRCAAAGN